MTQRVVIGIGGPALRDKNVIAGRQVLPLPELLPAQTFDTVPGYRQGRGFFRHGQTESWPARRLGAQEMQTEKSTRTAQPVLENGLELGCVMQTS